MSTLRVSTIQDTAGSNSSTPAAIANGIAKAWVNFDGTTSPITIRAQYNVSSITDNAVGNYTVNFTTAMADTNFSTNVSVGDLTGNITLPFSAIRTITTTGVQIMTNGSNNSVSLVDRPVVCVSIFR